LGTLYYNLTLSAILISGVLTLERLNTIAMITQEEFLSKYNITNEAFAGTGLQWNDLVLIYEDYEGYKEELEPSAIFIFNSLMKSKKVHSVRYRIKSSEHLVEKIIRKKIKNQTFNITVENYRSEITDLIGLRALHLFKEDWENVHDFIQATWKLKEPPVANFRKGDSPALIKIFKEKKCKTKEHEYGYRSIHYLIESQPTKNLHLAEIQVRTIFF
jgi:putative GTP pyrophosphokinase